MKYFNYLAEREQEKLFFRQPVEFFKDTEKERLRYAVGGLLYIPATDKRIAQIILTQKIKGLSSLAICLEDAVGDHDREACIQNLEDQMALLVSAVKEKKLLKDRLPLLFVRVKDSSMLLRLREFFIRYSTLLTGVILPKITTGNSRCYLDLVREIASQSEEPFYTMPILEADELLEAIDRIALLYDIKNIFSEYEKYILNVRIGATDLCGLYGIRRSVDTPVYQISLISSVISDIIQVFGRGNQYTISGPVWEYFSRLDREEKNGLSKEEKGLYYELSLDRQNGMIGKTCIHPSQLLPVQASHIVSYENYCDANRILATGSACAGVLPSNQKNRMNEMRPHALWAEKVLKQASVYGVFQEDCSFTKMLLEIYSKEFYL